MSWERWISITLADDAAADVLAGVDFDRDFDAVPGQEDPLAALLVELAAMPAVVHAAEATFDFLRDA